MWPLNTRMSEAPSRRRRMGAVARCAALCVTCLTWFALTSQVKAGADVPASLALRDKDVRRAEKVITKLRLLDELAARDGVSAFRDLAARLYPGLFIMVAEMHKSDLKTDLDTAVFLYEEVGRTWLASGDSTADCGRQRRDIYLSLCLELRGGTVRQLLLSKARLHMNWAEAVVKNYRGEGDAVTFLALSAMKAARGNDLVVAARIVETLKILEGLVKAVPTHADDHGRHASSRIGFDHFDRECGDALPSVGALLASLPRSLTFYYLSNAWRSYKDGQFWYRKVYQSRKLVVSANGFERDPLRDLKLEAAQVSYTVVVNWEAAMKCTRLAEQSMSDAVR